MSMANKKAKDFVFPPFYDYPPYFTLQPVADTKERQTRLWKELIIEYCKQYRIFIIDLDEFELFQNEKINRKLSNEAKECFLGALVSEGKGEWMDKSHKKFILLWKRIEDWADYILKFVRDSGLGDTVMTMEELRSGDETRGSEFEGMDYILLKRAIKVLESRGNAVLFKGTSADDEGVKFFSQ